jgi:hypothetical protein
MPIRARRRRARNAFPRFRVGSKTTLRPPVRRESAFVALLRDRRVAAAAERDDVRL